VGRARRAAAGGELPAHSGEFLATVLIEEEGTGMKTGLESMIAFGVGLGTAVITATAGEVRQLEFVNGETVEGIVIPASECPVVVQTEDFCLEVPLDRIRAIDGDRDVATALGREAPPLLRAETFEELRANGDVLLRSSFSRANRGASTRHEIDWGIAPHEVALLDHWRVFDEFGQELVLRTEEREDGGRHAYARLARPILPGETVRFTSEILFPGSLHEEDGTLRYRHRGDYPEDRLVSKMLMLPAGAEIVSVSPEPADRFDVDGVPYVYWRRYYKAGEELPLEIVFRVKG
jgi:hypothetical protein